MKKLAAQKSADNMLVSCFADAETMGKAAACEIGLVLRDLLQSQAEVRMIFAAAPSQTSTLKFLSQIEGIDWSRVTAFHMDEYIGLPEKAPQKFSKWLDEHLFEILPFGQVQKIQPDPNPLAEVERYNLLLGDAPIDIVCLGVGVNGHIAFNDPPVADFNDPLDVKVVELDEVCRMQQVDEGCFEQIQDVPKSAITLTIPALMGAKHLICVVPGSAKRPAVNNMIHGEIETNCPASILRKHKSCKLFLDVETCPYSEDLSA